jgi:hypothetical protein
MVTRIWEGGFDETAASGGRVSSRADGGLGETALPIIT